MDMVFVGVADSAESHSVILFTEPLPAGENYALYVVSQTMLNTVLKKPLSGPQLFWLSGVQEDIGSTPFKMNVNMMAARISLNLAVAGEVSRLLRGTRGRSPHYPLDQPHNTGRGSLRIVVGNCLPIPQMRVVLAHESAVPPAAVADRAVGHRHEGRFCPSSGT